MNGRPLAVGDLDPNDDLMHPVTSLESHNESMFFNFFDPAAGLGGFVRIGNRPNEGHAEMTFCIFLPDGSLLFQWGRPSIDGNEQLAAAGLRFDVVEPGTRLAIEFDAEAVHLKRPLDMVDPGAALRGNPRVPTRLVLDCTATSPMIGSASGSPDAVIFLDGVGHYQQACVYSGTLQWGSEQLAVNALGVRDHSWGKRVWHDLFMDRSFWVCFSPDLAFIACKTWLNGPVAPDEMGCVIDHGAPYRLRQIGLVSTFEAGTGRHSGAVLDLEDERGERFRLEATALTYVPLRHRKPGQPVVHLGQAMSRFTCGEQTALGLSEYFDAESSVEAIERSPLATTGITE